MSSNSIESGAQLFSRLNPKNYIDGINPKLFPDGGPHLNQIIEITGPPDVDLNNLLIDLIIRNILPNKYNPEWKSSGVVLINTEFQINIHKLIKVMEIHISKHGIKESKMEIIETALKNLTIFNCFSLEDVKMSIYGLERCVQKNDLINLIVIDNIISNYWISKMNNNMLSYYQHCSNLIEKIYNAVKDLNVTLIFGKPETSSQKSFSKVDYKIDVQESIKGFIASITNEKQETYCVNFTLDKILIY